VDNKEDLEFLLEQNDKPQIAEKIKNIIDQWKRDFKIHSFNRKQSTNL
jgi:predicted SpoU family rRNA methylase